jgi:endogenous inhibitor of DNA gyrase (YacG/DUF329 family)
VPASAEARWRLSPCAALARKAHIEVGLAQKKARIKRAFGTRGACAAIALAPWNRALVRSRSHHNPFTAKVRVMRFLRTLLGSFVEVVSGVVLIGVGVYVSSVGSSDSSHRAGLLAAGGILTTFGGVLLSWIASRAFAREQARADFTHQLGNLSRNLGQAAGQISRAVDQALVQDVRPDTGFALISQANRMIYGQVNEISVIQGAEFDAAYLLETASTLDQLALQLAGNSHGGEALAEVRRELEHVRNTLSRGQTTRTYSRAMVDCPSCGASNGIELGDVPGDTASHECSACGSRFNAHRAADSKAFTRPVGPSTSPAERWHFTCPSCAGDASTRFGPRVKTMACTHCFAALAVDSSAETVSVVGKYSHSQASLARGTGARPILECPTCGTGVPAVMKTSSGFMGFCTAHRQAIEMSFGDWNQWRERNTASSALSLSNGSTPVADSSAMLSSPDVS